MCETMANIPVEEKSSYVLTEDMIDAAMNEQFSYQEDLESEGELSSLEDNVEQDLLESCVSENQGSIEKETLTTNSIINMKTNVNVNTTPVVNISPSCSPISNNNKMSVLVIETGLDKNGTDYVKSVKETQSRKEQQNVNTPKSFFSDTTGVKNPTDPDLVKTLAHNVTDLKADLTILKSILSSDENKDGVIDLCESEGDDLSEEDDLNEAESIDDELKSVMETNLMAEIGMAVNKQTPNETCPHKNDAEKAAESIVPRISVKNITQISTHAFNSLPQNGCTNSVTHCEGIKSKINENQRVTNLNYALRNPNYNPNIPLTGSNQCTSSIHINKIAVPHSSFVNSQGQRMKCIYVKSTTALPYVINAPTQTTATNTNTKYLFPQTMKKGQIKMPAIAALKNLTKNIQPQALLLPKNAKVLTVAQKLQKTPMLQNVPPLHHKIKSPNFDSLKKTLILNSKKTYTAPDTFPENPTYTCLDCDDKFLMKTSLANHIERRSMSIRYWCKACKSELQFYNRCALSIHLRGHNYSLKQIDPSCISINPIPKDMVEKGIVTSFLVTSFLKESEPKAGPIAKATHSSNKAIQSNKTNSNSADSRLKGVLGGQSNLSSHKITTVTGQSKSVCYQSPSSNETSRPVSSAVANTPSSNKGLPFLLPKSANPVKAVGLVSTNSLPKHATEQSASSTKSPPTNVIVFCNKLATSPNVQLNSVANPIPPNVVCEADSRENSPLTTLDNGDSEMVIDDDASVVPNNIEEEEVVDVENIDGNVSSSSIPAVSESQKSLLEKGTKSTLNSSPPGTNKRNCTECKMFCPNISKHLNGFGRPVRTDLACKICNLILPTKCALKIHHRIHLKISPHKCPDCGKDFTSWDDLHAHLKFSCGHFAKCVRFICKGCKAHFPTQNGLAHHIVKNHGKDIFKCSRCPVAFYKKPSLIKHITNDHPNEKNKLKLGLDYKQCEMCPKKLLPQESYVVHAKEHTNSMIYGYKCSMCNIVYANKMAFIIHQIKEKTKRDSLEKSGNHSNTVRNEKNLEQSLQISDSNSDFEDEPVIIRKYPEMDNDLSIAEKDPLSLDDWECTQEQKVEEKTEAICIVCKKNSVVLLPGIDLNRQSLCCKQCVKPLDGDSSTESSKGPRKTLNSHPKSTKHKPINIYRSSSTDEVKKGTKKRRISDISQISSPENENLIDPLLDSPSKKKSRKKQKEKFDSKGQTHIQGQVIKSRSLDELCHKCSKCEFVTEERETFLEHITMHRTDPNTYQCLECGLSFVVLPSLERHLQMHHGIKDTSSYTDNNKASLPQKAIHVEEETHDNQCRVCYEIFDCKSSLDKHFRIHGMAFMSRLSKSP